MRTALIAALAALGLTGCSLMIDPDGVAPPDSKPVLGACIGATGGHQLCGGRASGGAQPSLAAPSAHGVERGTVDAGGANTISGTSHKIQQGIVSP